MTLPRAVATLGLLLAGQLAMAGAESAAPECEADERASQVVRVAWPTGAMLAVSDDDGELRIVIADARGVEGDLVARVRFRTCKGAAPPPADALRCRVVDASDDHANPLGDVTCSVTLE